MTVIVPTFNRLVYVERALRSILSQTFESYVVLVWDDGGRVDVRGLLRELNDNRLIYRRNEVNQGIVRTNIAAYAACTTPYVAHLDDDDEWDPRYLESVVGALDEEPRAGVAFCNHVIIDGDSRVDLQATTWNDRLYPRSRLTPGFHADIADIAVVQQLIPTSCAAVFRTEVVDLEQFPEAVGSCWDLWLAYLAVRSGRGAVYVAESLVRYRQHGVQETQRAPSPRLLEGTVYCFAQFIADPRLTSSREALRLKLSNVSASLALALAREGRLADARRSAEVAVETQRSAYGFAVQTALRVPEPVGSFLCARIDDLRTRLLWPTKARHRVAGRALANLMALTRRRSHTADDR